jgi:hypothetical protein
MAEVWRIEDHCCRACLGRVASRIADDGQTIVQCSNCGAEGIGATAAICCCGIRRGKFDRLRCIRLDRPPPGVMAQVVVSEVDESGGR